MATVLIGQLAENAGVGIETIRFYERRGLVKQPSRPAKGYRQYDEHFAERIRFIQQAQDLGFTLEEIRELLSLRVDPRTSCAVVKAKAQEKVENIDEKIRALRRMREALVEISRTCSGAGPTSDCPILDSIAKPKKEGGERDAIQER